MAHGAVVPPVTFRRSLCIQENASRPDHLPPSQGGKYVGFGSAPMAPKAASSGSGVEGMTTMLSSLATTAAATVRTGTQSISKTLQDKQVAEVMSANAKVIQERATQAAQVRCSAGGGYCIQGRQRK